jgi:tetratricopeptide (TPR) repeat protein
MAAGRGIFIFGKGHNVPVINADCCMKMIVQAWEEMVALPTYETGKPEKNPLFLEKRVYQGSSGAVYPHPVVEKIHDEKILKEYRAFFIENQYLKIMVLPEFGGRIHRAYDKVRKRDFVYYNEVIKPALVGLTGPWISGGIEFNWPQHHRPSTFEPLDCTIEENKDGSKTIWVNEVEIMFRTKGMTGFTLYPDKAYLEVRGKIYNRTSFPQSFLWWANPAVKVNDHYQSIFPPDVHAVFDHGKRDVSDFPVATGTYYKVDYAPGTDISMYRNIPVPTSYMAVHSRYDFIGCYEHDTEAGMVHIANHHLAPGKKQWTWGNGEFGKAWDRNLTDSNGPYVELMTGVFTDNQPDFSWLQPNEQKEFEQYFMPYAKTGGIKNATKDAILNLILDGNTAAIKVYATAEYPDAKVILDSEGNEMASFSFDLSPEHIFDKKVDLPNGISVTSLKVTVKDARENILVSYQPPVFRDRKIPAPAAAAAPPGKIKTNELLFLTGLHLEQYRHATYEAMDYYAEALRRDPADSRCNNAMGLLLLRKGQFIKAESFFRKSIDTINTYNTNPYNGEAYYNLGCCLQLQERYEEAFGMFYKSVWNDAGQHNGFLSLARIASRQHKWTEALRLVDQSLEKNCSSHSAMHLKIMLLRREHRVEEALDLVHEALTKDAFNYGAHFEYYLLLQENSLGKDTDIVLDKMKGLIQDRLPNYLEYALDYAIAGFYKEAFSLLQLFLAATDNDRPIIYYYLGWFCSKQGDRAKALKLFRRAAELPTDYCFPNKLEEILIFRKAIEMNPFDSNAYYYLGNLWYDKRQYDEAIDCWEKSAGINGSFPTVHRNLGLAYYNKRKDANLSLVFMKKAFSLDPADARVLMELDQLYKTLNRPVADRLSFLAGNTEVVNDRDDLYLELITLYNLSGKFSIAKALIIARKFHPWEGGEGKVIEQYQLCCTERARQALMQKQFEAALELLSEAENYPDNLGEGKLYGKPENDIDYLKACAWEGLNVPEKAKSFFAKAAVGASEPVPAIFYNDPQPDKILYQGLANYKLGKYEKAKSIFQRLISFGQEHMNDEVHIDYFAVSLPDLLVFEQDLQLRNRIHCEYLIGLGNLGLGEFETAQRHFTEIRKKQNHHTGAFIHSGMIDFLRRQNLFGQVPVIKEGTASAQHKRK